MRKVNIPKKFRSSIPLVIVGGLLFKINFALYANHTGIVEWLYTIILVSVYVSFLAWAVISAYLKYVETKSINYYPLIITLIVAFAIWFAFYSSALESKTIIYSNGMYNDVQLELKQNNTYKLTLHGAEESDFTGGNTPLIKTL